ncbi:penicillin acylase family protein [Aquincola sp. MAHUQ-54]|uniref:Penicillin acylase family protein n=1 Tax=Aquincola agrisoli TaxID=3119538 RepID=A0AAW9Q9D5_9BURK
MTLLRTTRLPLALAAALLLVSCGGSDGDDDGGPSIPVPGVTESVEIVRDSNGVAHIYAKNQRDLFFAQGYNAARDRLWQLDQWRRRGEGKMAEQFGSRFLEHDRAARLFLFRGNLDEEFASYHPQAKEILTAFSEGINAYIAEAQADPEKMPIEFRLTGTQPGQWTPTSSLIRIYGITRNVGSEISMARRIAAVGLATTQELTVTEPPTQIQVPAGIDVATFSNAMLAPYSLARNGLAFEAGDFPKSPLGLAQRADLAKALSAGNGTAPRSAEEREAMRYESNNWTVHGSRTDTGKPILAGDPHRAIEMPSLRYMVHLNAPGWNVIGAGEPALPGVSMGHNERIAFGLTIFAFGDEEDLYVYDTNPANPSEYRYAGAWEPMRVVSETISVRGQAAASTADLKFTRHGPVVYEDTANRKAYAVRAAYLEFPGTAAYLASLRLNQAQNWTEFTEGMAKHFTPGENMVYADVDGNIGWFGGAMAPIRPRPDWSGMLPVPGDGQYEWAGYLPGSLLPRVLNPPQGFFATANEFNVPADYAYRSMSATSWAEPYRFQRASEVLAASPRHTVADSARLQIDELSIPARTIGPLLTGLVSDDAEVTEALNLLRAWNHVVSIDSVAATIHELWLPRLLSRVSELVIPPAGRSVFGTLSRPVVLAKLAAPDAVFGPDPTAGRNAVLLDTLKATLTDLKARRGTDKAAWQWGQLHHIQFEHELSPFLATDLAESLATARYPVGGDGDTLHRGSYRTSDFRVTSGASYRQVIDLSNWDNSLAINVPGQSADPQSPYYKNLIEAWSKGEYFPMAFSRSKVDSLRADSVTLRPQR